MESTNLKLTWTTEKRKVKDLVPMEINPSKISAEQMKQLAINIERFNVVEIPVIDIDNTLITYHQRTKALIMIGRGEDEIDVRMPNRKLTEKEIKEYNLIANTHSGQFDMEKIEQHFADIDLEGLMIEIQVAEIDVKEDLVIPAADEDEVDNAEEIKTDIMLGDLFQIGPHRLLCGDSTNADDVAKLMNGEKADMLTDPPYGININMNMGRKKGKKKKFIDKKWDHTVPDFFYLLPMFDLKIIWGGNYFADNLPISKDWLCWYKKNPGLDFSEFELAWTNTDNNARMIEHHWSGEKKLHPTMKPLPVMKWCMQFLKSINIFDPFIGSGSTMVAAHQLSKNCFGIEMDPIYCQIIINRMQKLFPGIEVKKL